MQDVRARAACRSGRATCRLPSAKRPKPSAANAAIDERIVAIFFSRANAASIDGCAGFSSSMTSPSTSSFSYWPRGGSLHEERDDGDDRGRDAEHEERPAPAFGAAGPRRDRADEHRAEVAEHLLAEVHDRRHPGADADRVVVGDAATGAPRCRSPWRCRRSRRVQNNMNALSASAGEHREHGAERGSATPTIGTRFMRSASQPSGIAPSA